MTTYTKRPYTTQCRQGVFNLVTTHLMMQRRPSASSAGSRYRGPDGLQCALGCLIQDDHYSPTLEGNALGEKGSVLNALIDSGVAMDEHGMHCLLSDLQTAHDSVVATERLTSSDDARPRWIVSLDEVAKIHGLDSDVLDPWRWDPVSI